MIRTATSAELEATWLYGLRAVRLKSAYAEAVVLPDKGADLHSFRCLRTNTEMLAQDPRAAAIAVEYMERGATTYGDCYIGGWPSLLPSRAQWDGGSLGPADCGEAATACWETREMTVLGQPRLSCAATLPRSGFRVVRTFGFDSTGKHLDIDVAVTNASSRRVDFNWTEHPTFGGDVLADDFELLLPPCEVMDLRDAATIDGEEAKRSPGEEPDLREIRVAHDGKDHFRTLRSPARPTAAVFSASRGVGVQLRWDSRLLPHAWYWQSHRAGRRVLAIEPSNSFYTEIGDEVSGGLSLRLEPGDTMSARFTIGLIDDVEARQLRAELAENRSTPEMNTPEMNILEHRP